MIYRARYVLPAGGVVIENGEVLVGDGLIVAVGAGLAESHPGEPVRDLGRCALLPGFVNAHSHVDYTSSRNARDGLNLWDWLDAVAFKRGGLPPYEASLASAMMGAGELALSGVTCLGDSSFSGAAAEAMERLGLRGIVYKELFGQSMGGDYVARCAAVLDAVRRTQESVSERILVGLSPHAVYTSNVEVLRICADAGLPVAVHAAETGAEVEYCLNGTGPIVDMRRKLGYEPMAAGITPVRVLNEAGLLKPGVSLAHCVHVDAEEIDMIAQSGAAIAHCPRSNAYLGAGIAPLAGFLKAGAVVGIGTDSAGSCGRLDFFEEMRFALGLARASAKDASVVTAKDILQIATEGGARALGLQHKVGKLQPGMRADMVAVDVSEVLPGEDLHLAIVSRQPRDVRMTMVDGREVVRDGRLVREDFVETEARLRAAMESQSSG